MKSTSTRMAFFSALVAIPLVLVLFRAGQTIWEKNSDRGPASIDLSHLDGDSFISAARLRIIEGLDIQAQDMQHAITAGHFQDDGGSICKTYDRIEFVFAADDSVVSGEPILMKVRGDCLADIDASQLSSLTIPYRKILVEKPSETTIQVLDRNKTEISFFNMGDSWPRSWSLKSVRIFNDSKQISVNDREIFGLRGRPVQIKWPN
ncbi:MAG: hypothetical protein AABZ31_08390 [Bdellovibrionota bacterium]|mgnify:CR=1 FL=1